MASRDESNSDFERVEAELIETAVKLNEQLAALRAIFEADGRTGVDLAVAMQAVIGRVLHVAAEGVE